MKRYTLDCLLFMVYNKFKLLLIVIVGDGSIAFTSKTRGPVFIDCENLKLQVPRRYT